MLKSRTVFAIVLFSVGVGVSLHAQKSTGPASGALIVDGGGATERIRERFVELAGGRQAHVVVFATGPSALRFGRRNVILNPDWPRDRPEWAEYEAYLKDWLDLDHLIILHTRNRAVANSEAFIAPLKTATGALFIAGNAGRYAEAYLGTRTQDELRGLLSRGGVIFGTSAGAIIQASFVIRGNPDKPLLIAPGRTTGFGFLTNAAINPHVTSAQRDAELVNVIDQNPHLLGLGIEDDAALLVRGNTFEVMGPGRVAIYDNVRRNRAWFYWLEPGAQFSLATWSRAAARTPNKESTVAQMRLRPLLIPLVLSILVIWPAWRISRKAGYSGLSRISLCVPIANWLWFAFAEWPIERRLKKTTPEMDD